MNRDTGLIVGSELRQEKITRGSRKREHAATAKLSKTQGGQPRQKMKPKRAVQGRK